jgi:hypothetical protein
LGQESVREDVSSAQYHHYFQKLDKEMYMKIAEGQIIDAVVRFLDSRGIDTSDLKERRTTILNNRVIVSGSMSVQADTVALGSRAQAHKNQPAAAAHA